MGKKANYISLELFGLEEEKIKKLDEKIKLQYGDDKDIYFEKISKSIWEDETFKELDDKSFIIFEELIRKLTIPDFYINDLNIALYMMMSYYSANKYSIDDRMQNAFDLLSEEDFDKKEKAKKQWNKNTLDYLPLELHNPMTSWCREYQEILFNLENIEIFDVNKKSNNISRYGYIKSRKIYECLKSTHIENILFLDITLGLSLTNCIYKHTREIEDKEILDNLNEVIHTIAKIPCINVRNEIAETIFYFISSYEFKKEVIDVAQMIISAIFGKVEEFFQIMLQIDWRDCVKQTSNRDEYLQNEQLRLREFWFSYYSDKVPYKEILQCDGKVGLMEDGENLSAVEMFNELDELSKCGSRINEYFSNQLQPMSIAELIEILRKSNKEYISTKKEDIKEPKRDLDKEKLYALVHREVMRAGLTYFCKRFKRVEKFHRVVKK